VRSLFPVLWHPLLLEGLFAAGVAYAMATSKNRFPALRRQRWEFGAAIVLTAAACGWPLGDLAAHVSLTATVVQRLVLMLAVASLLVASIPTDLAAALTRPRAVDRVVVALGHPGVAIGVVTVVGTATLVPAVVSWGSASRLAEAVLVAVTLAVGVVLWLPVLGTAPATRRLSYVAKGAYVLVASLVVTSLSLVWIFAAHPLYPSLVHQRAVLGISPLVDQQLAGFVAKLGAYLPMWAVGFVLLARSGSGDERDDPELRWVDVQREFERAERRPPGVDSQAS